MNKNYKEVYNILSNIEILSDVQYERLVCVYGATLVKMVMINLVYHNKIYLKLFGKYISTLDFACKQDGFDSYDCYSAEIDLMDSLNHEDNVKLINEILEIRYELEKLFKMVGCDDSIFDVSKIPWIFDKVEYCLEKCTDIEILDKIKKLYDEYQVKRNVLVEGNLKLVRKFAKQYYRDNKVKEHLSLNDLIQLGNMGLLKAIEKYVPDKNTLFSTFASYYIKFYIFSGIKYFSHIVKVPIYVVEKHYELLKANGKFAQELGRTPTNIELARYMNVPVKQVEDLRIIFLEPNSLDELIETTYDGYEVYRHELVGDDTSFEDDIFTSSLKEEINSLLMKLNERERFVLRNRYGFDDNMTYEEISKVLGISYQAVAQMEARTIKKLKRDSHVRELISYLR